LNIPVLHGSVAIDFWGLEFFTWQSSGSIALQQ